MTKKELVLLLEDMLQEMPDSVDSIHSSKKLFSTLSSIKSERFTALEKLYDISLYASLLSGDFAVLFHQFLSSSLLYERKYAMAKLYPLMNEGFKRLYGFIEKNTEKVSLSPGSYWKIIQELVPLMNNDERERFEELESMLQNKASFSWWKDERSAEVHFYPEKVYSHRCAQDDENVAILDATSFYAVLTRTTALTTIMLKRLSQLYINS